MLQSCANASIVSKDVLYERHKILKETFNTIFVTEIILKLPEWNHSAAINKKYHLTDKLLDYDLILDSDILHELGIIFNFENKAITWQEVSISMKLSICTVIGRCKSEAN